MSGSYISVEDLSSAFANYPGKVRVKYNHGHLSVATKVKPSPEPNVKTNEFGQPISMVELGGVNGSCDVDVNVVSDKDSSGEAEEASAVNVHIDSLSPSSINSIRTNKGDVQLTFDRKVESDLRLLASKNIKSFQTDDIIDDCSSSVHEIIQKSDNLHSKSSLALSGKKCSIDILTNAFIKNESTKSYINSLYMDGIMKNISGEKESRYDVKNKGALGKINLGGAATQALEGFGNISSSSEASLPLFVALGAGQISVESLSWKGAIIRRYGMENDSKDVVNERK